MPRPVNPPSFAAAQRRALDAYAVAAESQMVPTAFGPVHVLISGEGPEILMVHGLGACSALWAPLLGQLGGVKIYAVDLPGHGLTPRGSLGLGPRDLRATMTRFLRGVMDALGFGQPATLVGNSLGSLCANWVALDRPESVSALAHIGCPALIMGASAPLGMRIGAVGGIGPALLKLRRPTRRQMEGLAALLGDTLKSHPDLAELLVAQDAVPGYQDTVRAITRSLVRLRGARPELVLGAGELRQITRPVQLVWGDADPFGPAEIAYATWKALPEARLDLVSGGHAPWLTNAPAVADHLGKFITQ